MTNSYRQSYLLMAKLIPDRLTISDKEINIVRKRWLGLKTDEDNLRIDRIASVRVRKGLFTAQVMIETTGGAVQDLTFSGIWKWTANKINKQLKALL